MKFSKQVRSESIKVFSPATVANVACGFDVFGFALNYPGDELKIKIVEKKEVVIKSIKGNNKIPKIAEKNTAGLSLIKMLEELDYPFGVEMELHKKMPIASGLGSSAASAVGSVFALNSLLKKPFSKEKLISLAAEGEKLASDKSVSLDNLSACLYGGFIIVKNDDPVEIIKVKYPVGLNCVIVHQAIELNTSEMRKVLKQNIPLREMKQQLANAASLINGLNRNNFKLISESLKDVIIEKVRAQFIPDFYEIKECGINAGALGGSISGSGPSLFFLTESAQKAEKVKNCLKKYLKNKNIKGKVFASGINSIGPCILEMKK